MASLFDLRTAELHKTPCPVCKRKGLHYAPHPHAQGWKDYETIRCRWCKARFKEKQKESETK